MSIKVNIRKGLIRAKFLAKRDLIEEAYERGVQLALGKMLIRTKKAKGVNNETFTPYSKGYAKVRAKRSLPTRKVDHFFTGKMLQSISARKVFRSNQKVQINIFPSADQEGKVRYTNLLRNWFGLSNKEKTTIIDEIKTALKQKRGTK